MNPCPGWHNSSTNVSDNKELQTWIVSEASLYLRKLVNEQRNSMKSALVTLLCCSFFVLQFVPTLGRDFKLLDRVVYENSGKKVNSGQNA
jgi:hypothetical protein